MRSIGLPLILLGAALVVVGLLAHFGALSWFGRLPGDVRIETERTRFYFPIVTMVLLSAGLSLALYLFRRFF
jgi:hypothetical protein